MYSDESLSYRPKNEQLKDLNNNEESGIYLFASEIEKINTKNNKEVDMYIDNDNVYLLA